MSISIFDLFKVGIGPSSSHTMGPMVAARRFACGLADQGLLSEVQGLRVTLYGSLALTGPGHGTDRAIMLGLEGCAPQTIDPESIEAAVSRVRAECRVVLAGEKEIAFDPATDLILNTGKSLSAHPNGMRFEAMGSGGAALQDAVYYSVGGGFVLSAEETEQVRSIVEERELPHRFASAAELLAEGKRAGLAIWEMVAANERALDPSRDLAGGIGNIWNTMQACVGRGCHADGLLPGGLKVKRRAPDLFRQLEERSAKRANDPLVVLDWVNLWAIAVNEENAAGGRVVTAPTNGAAGIIPAVLKFYDRYYDGKPEGISRFLLTAAAIGSLFKRNASISGAEVGCQGEVGVACSMAAAGLTAALGGTNEQVENAAEIGMEHNLGLTCDPIGGLVQIPCIERNAMAAVKAIDASRLAMMGAGAHHVSLDNVIETMRQTGLDMSVKYKETSQGGLAVNIVEC